MAQGAEMVPPAQVWDQFCPCAALVARERPGAPCFTSCHWINQDLLHLENWDQFVVFSPEEGHKEIAQSGVASLH